MRKDAISSNYGLPKKGNIKSDGDKILRMLTVLFAIFNANIPSEMDFVGHTVHPFEGI